MRKGRERESGGCCLGSYDVISGGGDRGRCFFLAVWFCLGTCRKAGQDQVAAIRKGERSAPKEESERERG